MTALMLLSPILRIAVMENDWQYASSVAEITWSRNLLYAGAASADAADEADGDIDGDEDDGDHDDVDDQQPRC